MWHLSPVGWAALDLGGEIRQVTPFVVRFRRQYEQPFLGVIVACGSIAGVEEPDRRLGMCLLATGVVVPLRFVESSPVTHVDVGGHRIGDPSAYNTSSAAQAAAMREVDNATTRWVAENRAKTFGYEPPAKPKAKVKGPTTQNVTSQVARMSVAGLPRGHLSAVAG